MSLRVRQRFYSFSNVCTLYRSFRGFCEDWEEQAESARGQALHTSTLEFERLWTNRTAPYATRGQAVRCLSLVYASHAAAVVTAESC